MANGPVSASNVRKVTHNEVQRHRSTKHGFDAMYFSFVFKKSRHRISHCSFDRIGDSKVQGSKI
jgi:hypothetical protein